MTKGAKRPKTMKARTSARDGELHRRGRVGALHQQPKEARRLRLNHGHVESNDAKALADLRNAAERPHEHAADRTLPLLATILVHVDLKACAMVPSRLTYRRSPDANA